MNPGRFRMSGSRSVWPMATQPGSTARVAKFGEDESAIVIIFALLRRRPRTTARILSRLRTELTAAREEPLA